MDEISDIRLASARLLTKEGIRRAVIAEFNFPYEAAASVILLFNVIELLLKEESGNSKADAVDLIDEKEVWDAHEKEVAHWARKRRNKVIHEGRFPEPERDQVMPQLSNVMQLVGGLWGDPGAVNRMPFTSYEMARLAGSNRSWQDESDVMSLFGTQYCGLDNRIALEMANRAFDIGVRGFARSWGLRTDHSIGLKDVIGEMEQIDDDEAHPSLFNDWTRTGYRYTEFGADDIAWFFPPMSLAQVRSASHDEWDDLRAAMNYTHLVRDVVLSYPERSPADPASGRQRSGSDKAPR